MVANMNIRQIQKEDSVELCSLLNEIFIIGGTTAFEWVLSRHEFENYFVNGKDCAQTILALRGSEYLGF